MFFFRTLFVVALFSVVFVTQVSAIIWPLNRYMLDVIPDGESDVKVNPASAAAQGVRGSLVGHTDVPDASGMEAIDGGQSEVAESSAAASVVDSSSPAPSSEAKSRLAGANSACHIALGSTSALIGSIVAGIVLTV
ncbi:hypothetical protein OH76DRAFT_1488172 [Lentinus brumalis]|uniref:DUF4203 domain-containing protein n=1 Tax=Lentinus brumalis TaxID=2498619 RepID=A0A371CS12_9APHY|nr:hypothetical protein OH76DRAFT_1488172 [Polyporus brumalis]